MPHEISPYQSPTSTELVPISIADEANAMAPHTPSTELVPMRNVYDAYNTVNRANLSPHTSELSAEDAERINNTYSIELCVGVHGKIPEEGADPALDISRPSEVEYAAVERLVASMHPGDVLFTERAGFPYQPSESLTSLETLLSEGHDKLPKGLGLTALTGIIEQYRIDRSKELATARQQRSIDAWSYAEGLAELGNIRVIRADADRLKWQYAKELEKYDPIAYRHTGRAMAGLRERDARNTVKDYALTHPDPQPIDTEPARKPRLVVLFGKGHTEGLEDVFAEANLQTTTSELEYSSMDERRREEILRRMNKIMGEIPRLQYPSIGDMGAQKGAFARLKTNRTSYRRHNQGNIGEPN